MPASTKCKVSNFDSKTSKINGIENLRVDLIFETVTDARRSSLHRSSTRNQDSMELASAASLLTVLTFNASIFRTFFVKYMLFYMRLGHATPLAMGWLFDSPIEAQ